jgi:menaquinone-dependent protoporphyrinogen oxidase
MPSLGACGRGCIGRFSATGSVMAPDAGIGGTWSDWFMIMLVTYATKAGSTKEVAEVVARTLREHGHEADLRPAAEVGTLAPYDAVVLGTALYTGRIHRDARRFLRSHRAQLAERTLAVFAMGPKTLADDEVAGSRTQLDRALGAYPELHPRAVAIFGGVVDPARLHFPFNRMPASDARDWDAIRAWADEVANVLTPVAA